MNDLISRQAAIDTNGLDEEIRCEMCRNPMHTDRGCDGYCKYDEKLYEKIIQILDKRITPLPSAQPPYNLDEWCHDCKEYDQERHCCPRFNKMIWRTLEDIKKISPKLIYCEECVRKCKFYDTQGDGGYCRYGKDKNGNLNPQREVKTG